MTVEVKYKPTLSLVFQILHPKLFTEIPDKSLWWKKLISKGSFATSYQVFKSLPFARKTLLINAIFHAIDSALAGGEPSVWGYVFPAESVPCVLVMDTPVQRSLCLGPQGCKQQSTTPLFLSWYILPNKSHQSPSSPPLSLKIYFSLVLLNISLFIWGLSCSIPAGFLKVFWLRLCQMPLSIQI